MKKIIWCLFVWPSFQLMAQTGKLQQLDSFFLKLEKEKSFNGNVLIARNDTVLYQRSIGWAEETTKQKLDEHTIFELASVSKQFTAMGILLLQQQGKLSLDDSLRKFFPELPYQNITVRHLLHHTSGLPDYIGLFDSHWDSTRIAGNKDMIALLAKHKPAILFVPGEKWEYSNTGYALLGSIIEKASGMSYATFLEKSIFKPLGMVHTSIVNRRYNPKSLPANYAFGYVWDGQRNKYVLPDSLSETASMVYCLDGIVGDGAVNATTGDLFRWSRALDNNKLLNKKTMEDVFTPGVLNNGKAHQYGYGWMVGTFTGIGRVVSHSGGWPGYRTWIEKHLDNGLVIIILTNYEKMPLPVKSTNMILYDLKETKRKEITLDEATLQQYAGEYQLDTDFSITITVSNGKIYEQATGQGRAQIFPEKEDQFFLKIVNAQIKFVRNEKKEIISLVLLQDGNEIEGKKIK
ncbi:MAG: serine hydrolase [Bacteroidetes bacterium]|nr:serine hydrolase [Bacteroidota bacterium]